MHNNLLLNEVYNTMERDINIDCWNFKNCPQDRKESCPAFVKNKGKSCWVSTGTLCGGVQQGDAKTKMGKCHACDFYIMRKGSMG